MISDIRVLVVDDSALIRHRICDAIERAPGMSVCGTAVDGVDALEQLESLQPDVITLDVLMPRMGGLEALPKILARRPLPIIMVSSEAKRAHEASRGALQLGAMDYLLKPPGVEGMTVDWREELVRKIRLMASADVERVLANRNAKQKRQTDARLGKVDSLAVGIAERIAMVPACIAIGVSTGGPAALAGLMGDLRPPLPAILIVQHMPEKFTAPFAERLDLISPLRVKEAEKGDLIEPNHVYVAPGGKHLKVAAHPSGWKLELDLGQAVSGHRPSIDVMMNSVAERVGENAVGIIMTGMGKDGAEGCRAIREAGGYVLGQDQSTSDIYGMNKVAFQLGHVDRQFSLPDLPRLIHRLCRKGAQNSPVTSAP